MLLSATPIGLDEVRAAARQNLEAIRAQLEQRRAGEQSALARSVIYPHLSLDLGISGVAAGPQRYFDTVPDPTAPAGFRQQSVDVPSAVRGNFDLRLTVSQLLYDGGKYWSDIARAGALEEAAFGQAEEQRLASELEAVRRYYELLRAQRTVDVLEANVQRSAAQLERAKALFEAGKAAKRDEIDAEVNLGNDRIAVLRQRQRVSAAQVELATWLSRSGADELLAEPSPELAMPPPAPAGLPEALGEARVGRPLMRALESRVRAARGGVEVAGSSYLPKVSAFGAYSRQSPSADPFFTDASRQNAVSGGVTMRWDLFSGLSTGAQVRDAEHQRALALAEQAQAIRELEGEVRRTHSALLGQVEISKLASANRGLAERGLKLAEDRFQAGSGTSLEVRDAQLKLTQAELSVLEGRIDVEIARAALARAVGGEAASRR
ncbi:MAG: TolC family protein [Myxococcales bacterium]|nr:TolC family protein [Myxococcales bacterium]